MNKNAIIEGLLFVMGDEGITKNQIKDALEIDEQETDELIESLKEKYSREDSGIKLDILADRYKLTTKPEHIEYYKEFMSVENFSTLSQATLETLAIIAYNQPVTRAVVNDVRGVDSAYAIRKLVLCDFIKEVGRADLPGRPIEYAVTSNFLDYFGLSSIDDLPSIENFNVEHLVQDEDLFET